MYVGSRKMTLMNLFVRQEYRSRRREQTCGHSEGREGQAVKHWHMHCMRKLASEWGAAL